MVIHALLLISLSTSRAQTLGASFAIARQAAQAQRDEAEKNEALSKDMAQGVLSAQELIDAASDAGRPLWLREEAIYNLGIRYFIQALPAIKKFAADPNPRIAAQALGALEQRVYPDRETVDLMLAGLKNRAPEPRIAAADALRQFKMYKDLYPKESSFPSDEAKQALKKALAAEKYYYAHARWVAGPPIVSALEAYGVTQAEIDQIWRDADESVLPAP